MIHHTQNKPSSNFVERFVRILTLSSHFRRRWYGERYKSLLEGYWDKFSIILILENIATVDRLKSQITCYNPLVTWSIYCKIHDSFLMIQSEKRENIIQDNIRIHHVYHFFCCRLDSNIHEIDPRAYGSMLQSPA